MKVSVIVFPGSNCDRDVKIAIEKEFNTKVNMVWHRDSELPTSDLIVIPGGFSYGDYLRSGAIAAATSVMREVESQAAKGVAVLGICNGFQILTESGLLPGALLPNDRLKFVCRDVHIRVENINTPFTKYYQQDQVLRLPIAHHGGQFFITTDGLRRLEDKNQVAFRYCDGNVIGLTNPNGSISNIAGIYNEKKTVLGLMPHPERAADAIHATQDGRTLFRSLAMALA